MLTQVLSWVLANPAATAWAAFGVLSAVVTVYKLNERAIRALVAETETTMDDRVIRVLDAFVAVFEVLRLFVPHGLARPTQATKDAEDER